MNAAPEYHEYDLQGEACVAEEGCLGRSSSQDSMICAKLEDNKYEVEPQSDYQVFTSCQTLST